MISHILGFPRIGAHREAKFALEAFWKGALTEEGLEAVGRSLRAENRAHQKHAGLDLVTVGDFAAYDHVLTNFLRYSGPLGWSDQFRLARGDASGESRPWDMTKWFDTNYHYLVPELGPSTPWNGSGEDLLQQVDEALADGFAASDLKAVVLGPVTLLALSRWTGPGSVWTALEPALAAFRRILCALAARGIGWVQVDEPILALDTDEEVDRALLAAYGRREENHPPILLTTYFGPVDHRRHVIDALAIDGLHLDLVRGPGQLVGWAFPRDRVLSLGVIDGRNVWETTPQALSTRLAGFDGREAWVSTSCSLLHVPVDVQSEAGLAPELKSRLRFAVQKLSEVRHWAQGLPLPGVPRPRLTRDLGAGVRRTPEFTVRAEAQREALPLPPWPTTTIGSFPQTQELRALRARWKQGKADFGTYEQHLRDATARAIAWQDGVGLDVLVHGEFERNDMVEAFGELLEGYAFTQFGWVQSYGSRCVKPPLVHSDVRRTRPLTVAWASYAQSLTTKPVKGMLTGPVTMLQWSFVRDDLPRSELAFQVAQALSEEVRDLEAAGIRIIQVDEPAFREGLPLRKDQHDEYWHWAVESFHRTVAGVRPETQIHTHMCYSDFSTCLAQIAALDADVITIETSRSAMALLDDFGTFRYPNAIGPGVWDIHSPRVPSKDEMVDLLDRASRVIPSERLWVNPDCGLKTRDWPEVEAGVRNLVDAARELRARIPLGPGLRG